MTVKELIEILQTMPHDAPVIHTMYSDYKEIERDDITLKSGRTETKTNQGMIYGGLVCHNGHYMDVQENWLPHPTNRGDYPNEPFAYVTAVHIEGN